jgi:aminopeptidase N
MAHQWFGDYVTGKDWSHLWLNEGFATYYSALYEGQKMGPDALLYTMYKNANNRVIPSGKNDTRPIVYKGYSSPDEQFDYRSYPKGAWVLHMLRSRLGKELYRQCIKTYLERNALTSVVTEELNEVIEEISGRSFDPFFDQWVYHARHPDLKIEYRWQAADKLAKVTIRQTQKTNDDVMLFEIPTKLRFDLGDGEVIDHAITIDQASHDFYVSLSSAPKVVRFDPEYTVLADISFSKPDAMLLEQLKRESDVIGRIYAVEALAKRKTKKSVAALKETLNDDAFYGVRLAAASALGKHASDDSFEALLQSTKQEDARVRREVVKQIGRTYRDEARELLRQVIENDSNPGIAAEALRAIAKYQSDDIAKLIVNSLKAQSFRNEVASAAISAIRDQADSSYADSLLAVLKERQNELGRRTVGSGMDVLARLTRDADDKSEVREFLMGFVADSKSPLRSSAIRALGTLGDEKVSATLRALSGSDREGRIASAAKSALGKIQKETKFVPREVSEMRKMLNELKQSHAKLKEELESIKKVANAKQKAAEKAPENAPAVGKEEPSKEVAKSKDVPKETASVGGAN